MKSEPYGEKFSIILFVYNLMLGWTSNNRSINGSGSTVRKVTCNGLASHQGGVATILIPALCHRNQNKLWPDGTLGPSVELHLFLPSW